MSPPLEFIHHVDKNSSEESSLHGAEQLAASKFDFFVSGIGMFESEDNSAELELALYEHQVHFTEFGNSDDMCLQFGCPSLQSPGDDIRKISGIEHQDSVLIQPMEKTTHALPSSSFQILQKHRSRNLKYDAKKSIPGSLIGSTDNSSSSLSTDAIIELAAENFIQFTSWSSTEWSTMLGHPCPGSLLGLSVEDLKGVQLTQNLLFCAEKVNENQHERARKLLHECHLLSSPRGTPIQRLAFYFVEALYQRIGNEIGRVTLNNSSNKNIDPLEVLKWPSITALTLYKEHPLSQIAQFTGTQAAVENVAEARKVHMIDFEIRSGLQCIILMQALAARCENPIQHLRITAVGTKSKDSKLEIEETGGRLMSFAQSLNLKFSFDIVMVEDILDLNVNLFKLDADEAIAVYATYTLTKIIGRGGRLEHMMKVIKHINPRVMIVSEMEANCNSSTFVGRFVEGLFYFGAFFDSLADCMKNSENIRAEIESKCFSFSIRNLLSAEGEEKKIRHVSINVWREFFSRCGLVEIELSKLCLCHAKLVLQRFACQGSCTLAMNGKGLIIGWKGTPLSSLSAWKFQ